MQYAICTCVMETKEKICPSAYGVVRNSRLWCQIATSISFRWPSWSSALGHLPSLFFVFP